VESEEWKVKSEKWKVNSGKWKDSQCASKQNASFSQNAGNKFISGEIE
jgi:hypothetical protein